MAAASPPPAPLPRPLRWRRLLGDAGLALVCKGLGLPLGYLLTLVLARLCGAGDLGTYTLASYGITCLSVVCRLGLDAGMLRCGAARQASGQKEGLSRLFWQALALVTAVSSVAALGVYLGGSRLAVLFHAPRLPELLPGAALALPLMAVAVLVGETLRSQGEVRWVVLQHDFLTPALLFLLVLWLGRGGLPVLGWLWLLAYALGLGWLWLKMRRVLHQWGNAPRPPFFGELWHISWPLYLSALLMLVFNAVDSLILGVFTGPEAVAYYEAALRTASLVGLPLVAVNAATPPRFARLHQEGRRGELEELGRTTSRWMYYGALPLALLLLALAPEILRCFGPPFPAASLALRLLALAHLANVACGSVGFLLAMTGHQLVLTRILAGSGALGLPLLALAAACWGLDGLALAKALWLIGVNLLMTWGVWRHLGVRIWAQGMGRVTAAGGAAVLLYWLAHPLAGPWAAAAVALLVYVALIARNLYAEFSGLLLPARWEAAP
jgi:O-antigen/teichoic acid export membrane protein